MKLRLLGERTGLRVSALALGTGRLGLTSDGGMDSMAAQATISAFLDGGGNFIDTSSAYMNGKAEQAIGQALNGAVRDSVVISSKFTRTPLKKPSAASMGNHRKALQAEVEGSLKRLATDRIDLYFAHFDDGVTPIEELMRGLDDLVRAGKVLYIGLSNFPAWRTATAAAVADVRGWTPLAVLQLQYNLLERAIDREHLPFAQALGLGMMAWSPLAGGLLNGKPRSNTTGAGGFAQDEQARRIMETVIAIATATGNKPADVAVAWLITRGFVPVIGPRTTEQLASNLQASGMQLDQAQMTLLNDVSARSPGYPYDLLCEQQKQCGIDDPRTGRVR